MDTFYLVKIDHLEDDKEGTPKHKKSIFATKALSVIEAIANVTSAKESELKEIEIESVNKAQKVVAYFEQDAVRGDAKIYKVKLAYTMTTANGNEMVTTEYLLILADNSELAIKTVDKKFVSIVEYTMPSISATQIVEIIAIGQSMTNILKTYDVPQNQEAVSSPRPIGFQTKKQQANDVNFS